MTQRVDNLLVNGLENRLAGDDAADRRRALVMLARQPQCKRIVRIFKRVMLDDPDPEMQYAARRLFNDWQPELNASLPDLPPMLVTGTFDEAEARRIFAEGRQYDKLELLKQLAESGDAAALPLVLSVIETEQDRFVLASLVRTLGTLGDASTVRTIQGFLKHEDSRVRANAVEALELVGDEVIWPVLAPLLEDDDHRVRGNVAKTLYQFDGDEAHKLVGQLAASDREGRRDAALHFLQTVNPPWAEELLFAMIPGEAADHLLKKAVLLLTTVGSERAVSFLGREVDGAEGDRCALFERALQELRERLDLDDERFFELKCDYADLPSRDAAAAPQPELPALDDWLAGRGVGRRPTAPAPAPAATAGEPSLVTAFLLPMVAVAAVLFGLFALLGRSDETVATATTAPRPAATTRTTTAAKPTREPPNREAVERQRRQREVDRRERMGQMREKRQRTLSVRRAERVWTK